MVAGLTERLLNADDPAEIIAALVDSTLGDFFVWNRLISQRAPFLAKISGSRRGGYTFGESDITGDAEFQHVIVFPESDNHARRQPRTATLLAKLAKYVTTVSFNQRELGQAKGATAWASITRERMVNALENTLLHFQRLVFQNGLAYGGKTIVGLQSLINSTDLSGPSGDTTMAINSKDCPLWRPQRISLKDEGRLNSPSALADAMMRMKKLVDFGMNKVDCVVTTRDMHNTYERFLQPAQRITKLSDAEMGYRSLDWNGLDVMWDANCPDDHMYFVSTRGLKLRAHQDLNMKRVFDGPIRATNQLAYVIPICWMGQMILTERWSQGVILA